MTLSGDRPTRFLRTSTLKDSLHFSQDPTHCQDLLICTLKMSVNDSRSSPNLRLFSWQCLRLSAGVRRDFLCLVLSHDYVEAVSGLPCKLLGSFHSLLFPILLCCTGSVSFFAINLGAAWKFRQTEFAFLFLMNTLGIWGVLVFVNSRLQSEFLYIPIILYFSFSTSLQTLSIPYPRCVGPEAFVSGVCVCVCVKLSEYL